jgi:hypothetical protein
MRENEQDNTRHWIKRCMLAYTQEAWIKQLLQALERRVGISNLDTLDIREQANIDLILQSYAGMQTLNKDEEKSA